MKRLEIIACVCGLLMLRPASAPAQPRPLGAATSRDVAAGQQIFDAQCAWCHGAAGTGGTGPDLRRATLRHAANDATLVEIVRNGIPGTEMPSFAIALTEHMAWQTAAYVRSLGRARVAAIPGDPQRGARVYESIACASCHVVNGRGGVLGPELTSIGALRGAPYLRDAIVKPGAAHPPAIWWCGRSRTAAPRSAASASTKTCSGSTFVTRPGRSTRCRKPACRASIVSSRAR